MYKLLALAYSVVISLVSSGIYALRLGTKKKKQQQQQYYTTIPFIPCRKKLLYPTKSVHIACRRILFNTIEWDALIMIKLYIMVLLATKEFFTCKIFSFLFFANGYSIPHLKKTDTQLLEYKVYMYLVNLTGNHWSVMFLFEGSRKGAKWTSCRYFGVTFAALTSK